MSTLQPILRDQRKIDADHLKLLAIFHFIFAALAIVGLGFLSLHWMIMHWVLGSPETWTNQKGTPPPKEFFAIFQWVYLFLAVMIASGGVGNALSGWFIRRRRARIFSLVVAGLDCLMMPLGTVLGVFTLIVLVRDSVVELYDSVARPERPAPGG